MFDRQSVRVAPARPERQAHARHETISTARFEGLDAEGRFRVRLTGAAVPVIAASTVALGPEDAGADVVVACERANPGRPIIIGRVHERGSPAATAVKADDARVVIRAEREIELRCGDASVILTRAGKVLIRGNYVLTRSRGANKIKGAVVDIN